MISYRKIGGIHWISIGRIRISFCLARRTRIVKLKTLTTPEVGTIMYKVID